MNANTAANKSIPFNNTIVMYQPPSAARSLQCRPTTYDTRCLLGLVNWSVEGKWKIGGRTDAGI
eukprot:scaffold8765_cov114-Skeletonema_dohrnii-CCMP3373.AAC.7